MRFLCGFSDARITIIMARMMKFPDQVSEANLIDKNGIN